MNKGKHEEAHKYHLEAQGMDDNNFVIYEWLGWNAYLREDQSSAIRYTKKSIKLNATNGDAYYNLGRIYQKQGKDSMALKEFKTAAKYGNKNAEELLKKKQVAIERFRRIQYLYGCRLLQPPHVSPCHQRCPGRRGIAHARILIASKALFRNQIKRLFIWSGFHHIYLIPPLPPIDHTIPAHIF
jgi:tetratricopeptide (TPR) repeat protein